MDGYVLVSLLSVGLLFGAVVWVTSTWRAMHAQGLGFFQTPVALNLRDPLDGVMEFLGLLALSFLLLLAFLLSWSRRR